MLKVTIETMREDYYSHSRPEVRGLIPEGAKFVVDVGCGAGAVGAGIKASRPGVQVRGIEPNPDAAARAARVLDDVAVMPADGDLPSSWPAPDCVIFADVLEHMVDPWRTLKTWNSRLAEGVHVVVNLPNVGHFTVVRELRKGRWDYEEEGLLDRTHLRFFTRATAVELLEGAGFRIEYTFRALLLPTGLYGREVTTRLVLRARNREAQGLSLPAWRLRQLDTCSRQFVFRARAARAPEASVPRRKERD
jgi:SAM-dependent methyltransferase